LEGSIISVLILCKLNINMNYLFTCYSISNSFVQGVANNLKLELKFENKGWLAISMGVNLLDSSTHKQPRINCLDSYDTVISFGNFTGTFSIYLPSSLIYVYILWNTFSFKADHGVFPYKIS